ncbi:epidermal growth factor receptor substrate 15-like 1 isoform X3 [Arachis ipaensis]|uniref:epidermal growth factor receptor substrate 15-like 1 isoform X3 n=1 Tax=Arachis ipaensis TaxID=130454 RepID=UPI0007AFBCB4|nr:epidermal growth factor receptor substrate 15-like 1 isoform X3 [Arachis ipaensis]
MASRASNVDLFDAYFRHADLDHDGRISGTEAVSFFQGSGLPKQVLAQIWAFANQSQSGFLGRAEFYNALKLVTVAQSKRELTPEIVKAALYGPATSKIPAPQINFSATVAPQLNSSAPTPSPMPTTTATPASAPASTSASASASQSNINSMPHQNVGLRGPLPSLSGNQQNLPYPGSPLVKPTQNIPDSASNLAPGIANQGIRGVMAGGGPHAETHGIQSDGSTPQMVGVPAVTSSLIAPRGSSPTSTQEVSGLATSGSNVRLAVGQYPASGTKSSDQAAKDSKSADTSGNGVASDIAFGGDMFSASSFQPKKDSSTLGFSSGRNQQSIRTSLTESLQSPIASQPVGAQLPQVQPVGKQNQHALVQTHNMPNPPGHPVRLQDSASSQPQSPWPRMTSTDIQKYTKVFVAVDTDRDGKITGEQARNLFLSWRLPREVLKQVWDLSDQDNDSMLSLREFCIALYLMEQHREGRALPGVLPSNILLALPPSGLPATQYSSVTWGNPSGFQQEEGMSDPGAQRVNPTTGRPPRPASVFLSDEGLQKQQKSQVPVLEKHVINQLSSDEQNSINSKFQEASEADKKVEALEKEIVESREKIEFCHAKMQELVLYKSRCDNRLNEIIERTSADKREVEILTKKYDDKYKQVGDVSSKLTTEEATFRDIQEKKIEVYQAIAKMEQDGNVDDSLLAHADCIQSDLDELVKSLNNRCKKYGLRAKPTTLVELPFGWQPGIQEGAADWDEDWDKLEDKEFAFVKELTLDVQNIIAPLKQKLPLASKQKDSEIDSSRIAASPKSDKKSENPQNTDEQEVGNIHNKSEDGSAKSVPNSPFSRSSIGSPQRDFADSGMGMIAAGEDRSPRDQDIIQGTQSDHSGVKSVFSGEKIFDEPNWGTFDANDDIDSVWGFNASSTTNEERDLKGAGDDYFFGSGDLGLGSIKTGSPQGGDPFLKSGGFSFDDSVPNTPLFSSSSSPQRPKEWLDSSFDNFSRFDSFRSEDSGTLSTRETPTRFDSVRRDMDFDHLQGFPAFDDSDPFGSGPFRTSSENEAHRRGSDKWSAF